MEANAKSFTYAAADAERFVYVVRGNGQAHVSEQAFPLEVESVLWLEKADTFDLEAGPNGLKVLLCHAPASE
jgi:redox-sensitive bicupin YhaK (pirin superfamily)